jgi:hypothetical protein
MLTKENVGKRLHKIAHFRVGRGMLKNVRFRITAQSFAESAIFAPMKVLQKTGGFESTRNHQKPVQKSFKMGKILRINV